MARIRLDKILADTGHYTRSQARQLIRDGCVMVDGTVCCRPEEKADPQLQQVCVCGRALCWKARVCLMMDKPEGVVSATEDRDLPTVLDLLPQQYRRMGLFPVGRLDRDTTGLLVLTDDGELAHQVISPKAHVPKRYCAQLAAAATQADVAAFAAGVILADGTQCLPAQLKLKGDGTMCEVTVYEGRYHQVKRMLAACGNRVTALRRLSIGALELDVSLGPGGWREMTEEEISLLFK